tara:strand:- start:315 stop:488 length:174 start_codon:yes stop_codon:yes gene_type:complete
MNNIVALKKAYKIINSCTTLQHIKVSKKYLDNYYNKFGDIVGYGNLIVCLTQKINTI